MEPRRFSVVGQASRRGSSAQGERKLSSDRRGSSATADLEDGGVAADDENRTGGLFGWNPFGGFGSQSSTPISIPPVLRAVARDTLGPDFSGSFPPPHPPGSFSPPRELVTSPPFFFGSPAALNHVIDEPVRDTVLSDVRIEPRPKPGPSPEAISTPNSTSTSPQPTAPSPPHSSPIALAAEADLVAIPIRPVHVPLGRSASEGALDTLIAEVEAALPAATGDAATAAVGDATFLVPSVAVGLPVTFHVEGDDEEPPGSPVVTAATPQPEHLPITRASTEPSLSTIVPLEQAPAPLRMHRSSSSRGGHARLLPSMVDHARALAERKSLEDAAARRLGVPGERLPRVLAQEGISRWAVVRATTGGAAVAELVGVGVKAGGITGLQAEGMVIDGLRKRGAGGDGGGGDVTIEVERGQTAIKRDFLIKLSRTFAMFGAPSHRLEHHLGLVSQVLDVEAEYILFPGMMMISFGGDSSESRTHILKIAQGFKYYISPTPFNELVFMGKLAQVNALCLTLTQGLISVEDAIKLLDAVKAADDYPWWVILATFPVTSFTICILGFRATWGDAALAAAFGGLVGLMTMASERFASFTYLLEFFASLLWSLANPCLSYVSIVLSSIAVLLPGLSLTIAIIELSTRNMVSGTVRLFGALFTAMLLGFGMTIGGALAAWAGTLPDTAAAACPPAPSLGWAGLLFPAMSMSVNLFFQANYHQWPAMILASAAGWVVSTFLSRWPALGADPSAVTAVAAIVIGVASNLHSRFTHDVAVAPILAGILLQVPGSLGVRSSLSFFQQGQNVVDGVQFTFQMLTVGMSLALGLFVATFLVWPIRGPRLKYLTM
ncbi:hypothetical protein HK101_011250 [Irineochytrium annulatum]|nr:hypothetical protein HK101_011250 [Irineochytrium annulatum]